MLLKGECVAALTEVLIVAQSRFQIDALQAFINDMSDAMCTLENVTDYY